MPNRSGLRLSPLFVIGLLVGVVPAQGFTDPAPPTVAVLAEQAASAPTKYPELRTHRAPRPRREDAVSSDWPGFLGPTRDSHSPETGLLAEWPAAGPKLVWEMRRGQGYAGPAIVGQRLVFTHRLRDEAHVDCLHAETGERFWRFSYPCTYRGDYIADGGPRATPLIADGRVYVHGVAGELHCLDPATGRVVWQRNTTTEFEVGDDFFGVVSSPLLVGDLLIQNVGAPDGPCVAAFDARTGKMVWGSGKPWGPSCASPMLGRVRGRARVFVLAGGKSRPPTGGLLVLDPQDGAIDFAYPFRSRLFESVTGSSPVVGEDWVFLSSAYGVGSAVLGLDGEGGYRELWKSRRLGLEFPSAVLERGHLYLIDGIRDRAGAVVCLDPRTGREVARTELNWSETVDLRGSRTEIACSVGQGTLLHVDGRFLCLGDNGHLLRLELSPEGARVLDRVRLFNASETWTPLAISRGLLYVCQNRRSRSGDEPARLLCYDLRAAE